MSLCALAQEARAFRYYAIQIEWLRRAIELAPQDGRAHGQAGDAYLALFRLDEAYTAYTNAVRFGQEAFGTRGIARVLQAGGRLDEALEICRRARDQFPDDPEAYRTGAIYSEILRDMWKLDEALASYEALLTRYPYEPVIWCGRAAVLKDMGRLFDALAAYSSAIKEFSNEPVAYGGRADVLKNLGRLDDALAAYDDAISRFPEEPIFLCGRADVLRSMGNYDGALMGYADAKNSFPYEPVAFTGYADVLKDQGSLEEALTHYDEAVAKFPQDVRCRTGRANVLRAAGRFADALQAYDQNVRDFPYDLFSLSGRAYLLKELAQYDEALKAFDAVIERRKHYDFANYAKAAIYAIMGRFVEAQALLPDTVPHTSAEWVAFHVRGMIYLKQNRLDEALDIFTTGSLQTPFYREQKYFENALAATKIRMKRFKEAVKIVHDAEGPIAHILQIHSYSELGLREAAATAYAAVNDNLPPSILMLRDELGARYNITGRRPAQSAGWIFEKEMEVLLQAA
jgi:tetratricopeptide (TPR) repeat protein